MKHVISKDLELCFGHRVWTQQLDAEFSVDTQCRCRNCHGHQGLVKIVFEAEELNAQAMVVDFKMSNWLKKFLDDYLDHKFLVDSHDPLYKHFVDEDFPLVPIFVGGVKEPVGHKVDVSTIEDIEREWYESFFIVDFCPTSENLSKWIYNFSKEKMAKVAKVVQVDWCETSKTRASYQE